MKKNPYLTFPREFTTGKWRVHLVYPGEPRADGFPRCFPIPPHGRGAC